MAAVGVERANVDQCRSAQDDGLAGRVLQLGSVDGERGQAAVAAARAGSPTAARCAARAGSPAGPRCTAREDAARSAPASAGPNAAAAGGRLGPARPAARGRRRAATTSTSGVAADRDVVDVSGHRGRGERSSRRAG